MYLINRLSVLPRPSDFMTGYFLPLSTLMPPPLLPLCLSAHNPSHFETKLFVPSSPAYDLDFSLFNAVYIYCPAERISFISLPLRPTPPPPTQAALDLGGHYPPSNFDPNELIPYLSANPHCLPTICETHSPQTPHHLSPPLRPPGSIIASFFHL